MSVVGIVLVLLVAGFILYMIQTSPIPVHPWIKTLIVGVIAFAVLVWFLNTIGVNTGINIKFW